MTNANLGPAQRTADSIVKIINFLLFRVPQKDKARYLSRIKGKIIRIPVGEISQKKMPASSSIGQAISLTKQILSGFDPIFVRSVINLVSNNISNYSYAELNLPLYKKAIDVVIMPMDAQVQEAVQKIKQSYPGILKRVTKIVVHPGADNHLGHVESGPDKDPSEIHLFKGSIDREIKKQFGAHAPTPEEYKEVLIKAIVEVIGHEAGHIGEQEKTQEQMMSNPFFGEGEAEAKSKEVLKKVYPQMAEDKFWKNQEDDLPASTLNHLKSCRGKKAGRVIGVLFNLVGKKPFEKDFEKSLIKWQEKNGLKQTGKIDDATLIYVRGRIPYSSLLPRNFGIVSMSPNILCRGGKPKDINELKILKNNLGIERIISLDSTMSDIPEWCQELGLEHVSVNLKTGEHGEPGWETLGPDILNFLDKKPTFIHCMHGRDRTGGVISRYRTESGWPCELAYSEAKAYGFRDIFTDMIDRMTDACQCKLEHKHPPVNTKWVKDVVNSQQGDIEQNLLEPSASDIQMNTENQSTDIGGGSFMNTPFGIRSIPVATEGGGR